MKRALITGANGQDGSYLSEYLLKLGYQVFGMTRRMIPEPELTVDGVRYIYGNLRDAESLACAFRKAWPDEVYNLGGQSTVPVSWEHPSETFDTNVGGLERLLTIIERTKPDTKIYQASSSEMFGNHSTPCNEETPLCPMSPYGISKAASHRLIEVYRLRGIFAVSGMLFNHESPRRGIEMVTRKIACHVADWTRGDKKRLNLGNPDSRRDWGFAGDYVRAMHAMLTHPYPRDFVIGTGESHSVKEFLEEACVCAELPLYVATLYDIDPHMTRTQEIYNLVADAGEAEHVLHWKPKVLFKDLVRMMVYSEMKKPYEVAACA